MERGQLSSKAFGAPLMECAGLEGDHREIRETRKVRATRRGPGGCGREQGLEGSIGTGLEGCRGDRKQAVKAVA